MKKTQFEQIIEWQKETFGKATSLSKLAHLKQEIKELKKDLKNNNPDTRLEFADCFFLLFGCASANGMSYEDICNAIQEKFEINQKRTWGNPDKDGVVNHVKQECKHPPHRIKEHIVGWRHDECLDCGKTWG